MGAVTTLENKMVTPRSRLVMLSSICNSFLTLSGWQSNPIPTWGRHFYDLQRACWTNPQSDLSLYSRVPTDSRKYPLPAPPAPPPPPQAPSAYSSLISPSKPKITLLHRCCRKCRATWLLAKCIGKHPLQSSLQCHMVSSYFIPRTHNFHFSTKVHMWMLRMCSDTERQFWSSGGIYFWDLVNHGWLVTPCVP